MSAGVHRAARRSVLAWAGKLTAPCLVRSWSANLGPYLAVLEPRIQGALDAATGAKSLMLAAQQVLPPSSLRCAAAVPLARCPCWGRLHACWGRLHARLHACSWLPTQPPPRRPQQIDQCSFMIAQANRSDGFLRYLWDASGPAEAAAYAAYNAVQASGSIYCSYTDFLDCWDVGNSMTQAQADWKSFYNAVAYGVHDLITALQAGAKRRLRRRRGAWARRSAAEVPARALLGGAVASPPRRGGTQ